MNVRSFGKICSVDSPSQWNIFCFRLAEVGKLEPVKLQGNYDTGQMFLHRVFGYRGVILFPWTARVYDRDMPNKRDPRYERGIVDKSKTKEMVQGIFFRGGGGFLRVQRLLTIPKNLSKAPETLSQLLFFKSKRQAYLLYSRIFEGIHSLTT